MQQYFGVTQHRYLEKFLPYFWVMTIASVLFLIGCSTSQGVRPDYTTYPRDLTRQESVKMSVLPGQITTASKAEVKTKKGTSFSHNSTAQGRPYLEYEQKITGDSATKEMWIITKNRSEWNRSALNAKRPKAGHKACGEEYRIISTGCGSFSTT